MRSKGNARGCSDRVDAVEGGFDESVSQARRGCLEVPEALGSNMWSEFHIYVSESVDENMRGAVPSGVHVNFLSFVIELPATSHDSCRSESVLGEKAEESLIDPDAGRPWCLEGYVTPLASHKVCEQEQLVE